MVYCPRAIKREREREREREYNLAKIESWSNVLAAWPDNRTAAPAAFRV